MAQTKLLSRNFDRGIVRDDPRDQLDHQSAYDLVDWIPQDGAALRKRGGWGMASRDLNALNGANYISALSWAPFSDPHLVQISEQAALFRSTGAIDGSSGAFIGTSVHVPSCPPFWHKDRLVILLALIGGLASLDPTKYYDSGGGSFTIGSIGGTPPRARTGWSWGDYLILANGYDPSSAYTLRPNRIWVSGVGNPDSWNTTASGGIWDMPDEVVGGISTRNSQIVFGYSKVWALAGDTPPPGGNWARRDLFSFGCMDGRTITTWRDYFIWANNTGIWKSDGATSPTELTKGISLYWRSLVKNFSVVNGWTASAGILYGCYVISILDNNRNLVATLVHDLDSGIWYRWSNVPATMFAQRLSGAGTALEPGTEELFGAWAKGPRSFRLSGLWTSLAANASDGDGSAVLPVLETPFYKLGATEQKRIRRVYLNYDLLTAGAAPKIVTGYIVAPEQTSYTEVDSTRYLPDTTQTRRRAVDIRQRSEGVAFRFRQTAASADTRIAELEFEGRLGESSR